MSVFIKNYECQNCMGDGKNFNGTTCQTCQGAGFELNDLGEDLVDFLKEYWPRIQKAEGQR